MKLYRIYIILILCFCLQCADLLAQTAEKVRVEGCVGYLIPKEIEVGLYPDAYRFTPDKEDARIVEEVFKKTEPEAYEYLQKFARQYVGVWYGTSMRRLIVCQIDECASGDLSKEVPDIYDGACWGIRIDVKKKKIESIHYSGFDLREQWRANIVKRWRGQQ